MKTKIYSYIHNRIEDMIRIFTPTNASVQSLTLKPVMCLILCLAWFNGNTQVLCEDFCAGMNLACNNQVNVSINEDCYAAVTTDLILEDPPFDVCPDMPANYAIELFDENGDYIIGHVATQEHVGQHLKASITLIPCNISCWGYVYVEDKVGPNILGCVDGFLPEFIMDCEEYQDDIEPFAPDIDGVCIGSPLDYLLIEDDTSNVMCLEDLYAVSILRTYTAYDEAGHSAECQQQILVEKMDVNDINMPDDYIVEYDDDCSIFDDVSPEVTGFPDGVFCPNIQFYYNDIVYKQCGVQRKLLREWFVIDWCTGESRTDGQIIKIIDTTPPVVECPGPIVYFPSAHYNCFTDVILDPYGLYDTLTRIKVIDECSLPIHVRVEYLPAIEGEPQPKTGPYKQVPINADSTFTIPRIEKNVWVKYVYEDDCGNRSTLFEQESELIDSIHTTAHCFFDVHIHDVEPPTAICEGFTKVQLGHHGIAELTAEALDDHSFDACGDIGYLQIKRENTSCPGYDEHGLFDFGDSVHFCCEDIGDTLTVRLRVFDNNDNFSECLGLVCVTSQVTPKVICPDDVTLDCDDDYKDRNLIGVPVAENGCDANLHIGYDRFDLTGYDLSCGTGVIIRTNEVTDHYGNVLFLCTQSIYFDPDNDYEALEEGDFDFPHDVLVDQCAYGNNVHPDLTGEPTTTKDFGCSNIAITYKDDAPLFSYSNGVCYTILRRWKIVDWCRYSPQFPNLHILHHVQEIKVKNSSTAQFNCPSTVEVDAISNDCHAFVNLNIGVSSYCNSTLSVTYAIDLFSDNINDLSGTGTNASDVYPVGIHTITYTAVNHCGGPPASCSFEFVVRGNVPPTPICIANLSWSLGFQGTTEVWASDFDSKSHGGCNGNDDLLFSFTSPLDLNYPQTHQVFTCDDIPDNISTSIPLEVYVIDESGLYEACSVYLQLIDSNDICPDDSGMTSISGKIMTEKNEPIEEVMVELDNMSADASMMSMTGAGGDYAFANLSVQNQYMIIPYSNEDPLNGVSTLDLLMIQRHILGQENLVSPYKLIAADIDRSGSISAIDLIELRKLILGIYEDLPENNSWTFVPEKHDFVDAGNPWDYPNYIDIESLRNEEVDNDFVAIKIGDVNESVQLDLAREREDLKSATTAFINTYNQALSPGELIAVPFMVDKPLSTRGMQFTFEFDDEAMVFEGIDPAQVPVDQKNFALLNNHAGVITFSISNHEGMHLEAGDVLFTAYFESRSHGQLRDMININSLVTPAELYDDNFEIKRLEMLVRDRDPSNEMEVFQNEPNPFDGTTSIAFSIAQRQQVQLHIFNANGKSVYSRSDIFDAGLNEFIIDANDLRAQGILFYRIESGSNSITRKMIVVK